MATTMTTTAVDITTETPVVCAQFRPEFGDTAGNVRRMADMVAAARFTAPGVIVFPELATSGYEFRGRNEAANLALELDGAELLPLRAAAARSNAVVIAGYPERAGGRLFNSAALFLPGGDAVNYRKLHLFDREKQRFDPGDAPPPVVETEAGRIGVMICFDWVFPEAARHLARGGAQLICHPSNLVLQYCQRAMFARSVENRVFTATCNRIGLEARDGRELRFTGASQILSPKGETLAQASSDREELIADTLDLAQADDKLITPLNHVLDDLRSDMLPPQTRNP